MMTFTYLNIGWKKILEKNKYTGSVIQDTKVSKFIVLMYLLTLCSLVRRPFLLKQLYQNRCDVRRYLNILVRYFLSTFSLQVVLKVSDIQVIMEHEHLLLNLHWILSKNTAPTTPVMNAIQFLTKICSQVPRSRVFLRDNLGLASTLTNLLVSLGVNSSSKSSKVLELLRFVSHGISIIRQESYLEKLIVQLLRLLKSTIYNLSSLNSQI